MKIAKNTVAALSYELEVEGKIADKAGADKPLEYIHGNNMLLPVFEANVEGKEPGDSFAFTLTPAEGYGEYDESLRISLSKDAFKVDDVVREDLLVVGNVIPMFNQTGQVVQGKVAEVKEDEVIMDFNHPMAGKVLHFTGTVVSVREATEKELEGCHCGCGCHEEGDGCHCHEDGCGCHEEGEGCHCGKNC